MEPSWSHNSSTDSMQADIQAYVREMVPKGPILTPAESHIIWCQIGHKRSQRNSCSAWLPWFPPRLLQFCVCIDYLEAKSHKPNNVETIFQNVLATFRLPIVCWVFTYQSQNCLCGNLCFYSLMIITDQVTPFFMSPPRGVT